MGNSSSDPNPVRSPSNELIPVLVRMVGTGGSAPDVVEGKGSASTIGRSAAGKISITYNEAYAQFLGITYGFQATTAANVKGHTVIAVALTAKVLTLEIFDDADALEDLEALEWLTVIAWFRAGSLA